MKSKFVLTEEESKRILSLHKEKVELERGVVSEQNAMETAAKNKIAEVNQKTKEDGYLTLPKDALFEKTEGGGFLYELKLFKGSIFKIEKPNVLISNTKYELVGSFAGSTKQGARKGTIIYNCDSKEFKIKGNTDKYFNEDLYVEAQIFKYACKMSKGGGATTPTPTPSKQGCPSIVKSFTDAGYSQITKERFDELSTDNTKTRKYKYCPVTKKNLYFAKPKQGSGGGTGVNPRGGGNVGNNQTFTFDYNQILTAINQKCSGVGGGGVANPEDQEIVNPFGQGAEQGQPQPQVIKVTDEIYAGLK
jgi:hypothetical protein